VERGGYGEWGCFERTSLVWGSLRGDKGKWKDEGQLGGGGEGKKNKGGRGPLEKFGTQGFSRKKIVRRNGFWLSRRNLALGWVVWNHNKPREKAS